MHRVVILQPSYIPWIGCFNLIANCDTFVFFDDVQYTRRDWRNRNYIKAKQGEKRLLTIPVNSKRQYKALVNEITINYQSDWVKQHLWILKESYRNTPYFEEVYALLEKRLSSEYDLLHKLCVDLMKDMSVYLNLNDTQFVYSSELNIGEYENASHRLSLICEKLNATHYLSGNAAVEYMETTYFEERNIDIQYHDYPHPEYSQNNGDFLPYLSIIDLIFNHGSQSKEILYRAQF